MTLTFELDLDSAENKVKSPRGRSWGQKCSPRGRWVIEDLTLLPTHCSINQYAKYLCQTFRSKVVFHSADAQKRLTHTHTYTPD